MNNLNLVKKKSNYLNIKGISTSKIVKIAMFGALSTILMYLDFPLPLSPAFAKMDFSDLPIILGGFIMGPMAGFFIILLKIVLILVLKRNFDYGGRRIG